MTSCMIKVHGRKIDQDNEGSDESQIRVSLKWERVGMLDSSWSFFVCKGIWNAFEFERQILVELLG